MSSWPGFSGSDFRIEAAPHQSAFVEQTTRSISRRVVQNPCSEHPRADQAQLTEANLVKANPTDAYLGWPTLTEGETGRCAGRVRADPVVCSPADTATVDR
jgi:hypothetical protein